MYEHERSLVKRMKDRPFVLLGVNSDRDLDALQKRLKEENITWPSFWNGPMGTGGPISALWNVRGWPTIYIIDHEGVIRDKNKRGAAMDKVVDKLVAEAEGKGGGDAEEKEGPAVGSASSAGSAAGD